MFFFSITADLSHCITGSVDYYLLENKVQSFLFALNQMLFVYEEKNDLRNTSRIGWSVITLFPALAPPTRDCHSHAHIRAECCCRLLRLHNHRPTVKQPLDLIYPLKEPSIQTSTLADTNHV